MNLREQSVMVFDHGPFFGLADRLRRDFDEVYYFLPWQQGYARQAPAKVGEGFEGIRRVLNFWDVVNDIDLFIFPDCYDGDLQVHLRSIGKRVWGSGVGEQLELDRWGTKQLLKKLRLPVSPTVKIIGLDALKKHLKPLTDKWIKCSIWREDLETYHYEDWQSALPWLDELAHNVGPLHQTMEFLVEDPVPGVEFGYDGFCIDGRFPSHSLWGYEVKAQGFIGKVVDQSTLPAPIRLINERLSPAMKRLRYRGFFSSEIRMGKDQVPYLIDPCSRMPSPPGEVVMELYENLAEILWAGADGEMVEPQMTGRYAAEVLLSSEWAKTNFLEVRCPDEMRNYVKLYSPTKIGESVYVVPQLKTSEIGAVIAIEDTMDQAIAVCKQRAEQVKGYQLHASTESLDKAVECIQEGQLMGVPW